ncbi:hypothetical protein AB3N59_20315 (plasmid) [Leptospira sp. WS92.C1]
MKSILSKIAYLNLFLLVACATTIAYAPQKLIFRKETLVFCMNVEVTSYGLNASGCDNGIIYECEKDVMLETYFKGTEIEKRLLEKQKPKI